MAASGPRTHACIGYPASQAAIQSTEESDTMGFELSVRVLRGQPSGENRVHTRDLGPLVQTVSEIDLVYDFRHEVEGGIIQGERSHHGFEAAAVALMSESHAAHIERDLVALGLCGVTNDGIGIDDVPDQPDTSKAIDVRAVGSPSGDPAVGSSPPAQPCHSGCRPARERCQCG